MDKNLSIKIYDIPFPRNKRLLHLNEYSRCGLASKVKLDKQKNCKQDINKLFLIIVINTAQKCVLLL